MSTTIEDRLREHYGQRTADLPRRGPGLEAGATRLVPLGDRDAAHRRGGRVVVAVLTAAAAAVVVVTVALVRQDGTTGGTGPAGSRDGTSPGVSSEVEPAVTLSEDDLTDVPATVAGSAPSSWYRLQPDLDVAWYADPATEGETTLCWRTSADDGCTQDGVMPAWVSTGGGQALVVITHGDTAKATADVLLSDGSIVTAPVAWDDVIGWGVVRVELAGGVEVSGLVSGPVTAADTAVPVAGATLPPAAALVDVPLTIAAGGELSYFRWLPDLDIAEIQRDDGGTDLCWRTPAGTGCMPDEFLSPEVGVIPTDGAAIALARPGLVRIDPPPSDPSAPLFEVGPQPTRVEAVLSDGTTVDAEVHRGDAFGVGYARIALPAGVTVESALSRAG